ncbi:hypothetical protein SLA2020_496190 [Shorea laevis]
MENNQQQSSFYQFSDQLRVQTSNLANLSLNDSLWSNNSIWSNNYVSNRTDERRNFDIRVGGELNPIPSNNLQPKSSDLNVGFNDSWKIGVGSSVGYGPIGPVAGGSQNINGGFNKGVYSKANAYNSSFDLFPKNSSFDLYPKNSSFDLYPKNSGFDVGLKRNNKNKGIEEHGGPKSGGKKNSSNNNSSKKNNNSNDNSGENKDNKTAADKRFKTLPPSEALPRNETIGGYIFVCNNDTMQENLKRQLFGLPPRYRDSVRAITPGLPLFLYNYSTHQLHGVFEAASFGGTNIDPTAWEDKKCPGESRFPAQVRVITRKVCEPLEEDSFRPILHHYDGPKFRLELNVPEAVSLLDVFREQEPWMLGQVNIDDVIG